MAVMPRIWFSEVRKNQETLSDKLAELESAAEEYNQARGEQKDAEDEKKALLYVWEQAKKAGEDVTIAIRDVLDRAQAYFDERSEKWQESERGEAFQDKISALENLESQIEGEIEDLICAEDLDASDEDFSEISVDTSSVLDDLQFFLDEIDE